MAHQLLSQKSVNELRNALTKKEKILYKSNGFRAARAQDFLKVVEKTLPKVGIKRIADISYLSATRYPVFQSCRPHVLFHSATGQNTGAQGKGPHAAQALISCSMEAIEGFCAEPREANLIRGSYNQLKNQHVIVAPSHFLLSGERQIVSFDEVLMWTRALHVQSGNEILVPAETVFFPFISELYATRAQFTAGANGLASGSTYLEATIHALYEVIERNYHSQLEKGKVTLEALHEEELTNIGIEETKAAMRGEFELQLYALESPGIKNLPMVICLLVGDDVTYYGLGCSANVEISIDRAISEALQSQATVISGSREDLDEDLKNKPPVNSLFTSVDQPERRTLRIKDFKKRVHDKKFSFLGDEFNFILKWLKDAGFNNVMIANLCREGIDLPVVKVIIPNMDLPLDGRTSSGFNFNKLLVAQFPNVGFAK